jgi:hypothetical protein
MPDPGPHLLPYMLPTRLGLPYHGLVVGNVLTHGEGLTKVWPQPTDGSTWKCANPVGANTRERTEDEIAHDTEKGKSYLPYALMSNYGTEKRVGQYPIPKDAWLYSDANGRTWTLRVTATYSPGTNNISIAVYLVGRFGVFRTEADPPLNRLIGSATLVVTLPSWWSSVYNQFRSYNAAQIASTIAKFNAKDLDFTETGSTAALNIRSFLIDGYGITFRGLNYSVSSDLMGWAIITVSGNGSVEADIFGHGITASVSTHGLDEVWEHWGVNDPPEELCSSYTPVYYDIITNTTTTKQLPGIACPADDNKIDYLEQVSTYTKKSSLDNCEYTVPDVVYYKAKYFVMAGGTFVKLWSRGDLVDIVSYEISGQNRKKTYYEADCGESPPGWNYLYFENDEGAFITVASVDQQTKTDGVSIGDESYTCDYSYESTLTEQYEIVFGYYYDDVDVIDFGIPESTWTITTPASSQEFSYAGDPSGGGINTDFSSVFTYAHNSNNCHGLRWALAVTDSDTAQEYLYDAGRLLITPSGETTLPVGSATFYASYQPVTHQTSWSDTAKRCYV